MFCGNYCAKTILGNLTERDSFVSLFEMYELYFLLNYRIIVNIVQCDSICSLKTAN
jgi:hypothetical protein